jgi:predicted AlkP superfamily phosphohydrolase/phosphomutase
MAGKRESGQERLLVIGWDGADWDILHNLIGRGLMPNLASMIREGASGELRSTIPSHSWAAWSTFMTGMLPGGHGVYDFVERHPTQPGKRIPVSSGSIKAKTFFEVLSGAGKEIRVANVPVTFPPIPIKGRMISGVAIPPGAPFVYPEDWSRELARRAPFPINGMEWTGYQGRPLKLIQEAHQINEKRTAAFEVMLEGDWDVAVCVYVSTDRLQHPLGDHLLPNHPDFAQNSDTTEAHELREVYRRLDGYIARLRAKAGPAATTVLMSDHGFRPINRVADLDGMLQRCGFSSRALSASATTSLRRSKSWRWISRSRIGRAVKGRLVAPSHRNWSKTSAYWSAAGGGISLNLEGREPSGIVPPGRYDEVRQEIKEGLETFEDPDSGARPVDRVFLREELYEGPHLDLAPDLMVEAAPLWGFSHLKERVSAPTTWPSGEHRQSGILVACGGRTRVGDIGSRSIADIAPTALSFCGMAAPRMDGRPIPEISGARELQPVETDASERPSSSGLSEQEQEHIAQHLRDLGYIE